MRCEDNINFHLSFDKIRKNDCWSDISHSISFSKIFPKPFKPEFIIKIVIHYKPQITVRILKCQIFLQPASRQPASSFQLAASKPALASRQPVAILPSASHQPARTTLAIYIRVCLNMFVSG